MRVSSGVKALIGLYLALACSSEAADSVNVGDADELRAALSNHSIPSINILTNIILTEPDDTFIVPQGREVHITAAQSVTLSGGGISQIMRIDGDVTLSNLVFEHGLAYKGAAIYVTPVGKLRLISCTFRFNQAMFKHAGSHTVKKQYGFGGGVFSLGTLVVANSHFEQNTGFGAGLWVGETSSPVALATAQVRQSSFQRNESPQGSGGAVVNAGHMQLSGCLFSDNTARTSGGAIFQHSPIAATFNATLEVLGCTFHNNQGGYGELASDVFSRSGDVSGDTSCRDCEGQRELLGLGRGFCKELLTNINDPLFHCGMSVGNTPKLLQRAVSDQGPSIVWW